MRLSKDAVQTPQTIYEASASVRQIGRLETEIERIRLRLKKAKDKLDEAAEAKINGLAAQMNEMTYVLESYANANRAALTSSGSKTVRVPAGSFGWRMKPWRVVVANAKEMIAELKRRGLKQYLRIVEEVDKDALRRDREKLKKSGIPGLRFEQCEGFFVEPLKPQPRIKSPQQIAVRE